MRRSSESSSSQAGSRTARGRTLAAAALPHRLAWTCDRSRCPSRSACRSAHGCRCPAAAPQRPRRAPGDRGVALRGRRGPRTGRRSIPADALRRRPQPIAGRPRLARQHAPASPLTVEYELAVPRRRQRPLDRGQGAQERRRDRPRLARLHARPVPLPRAERAYNRRAHVPARAPPRPQQPRRQATGRGRRPDQGRQGEPRRLDDLFSTPVTRRFDPSPPPTPRAGRATATPAR